MDRVLADLEWVANGEEISPLPLERAPDVFRPRNTSGREAAEALAVRFGSEPPPMTERYDFDSMES